ncbi:MAG: DUF1674 domain-containing protein [Alphaproteobacteria bacterium]|jgi:hypothetical protein
MADPQKKEPDNQAEDAKAEATKPAPPAGEDATKPDPTRYGDWEINGRCVDF